MAKRFRPVFIAQLEFTVVLPFEFFARFEEFVEEKSPRADAPQLASTVFFLVFRGSNSF